MIIGKSQKEIEKMRAVREMSDDFFLGKGDRDDGLFVAVDHAGDETGIAQALVGAAAELCSLFD